MKPKRKVRRVCRSALTGQFAPMRMAKCYPARYVVEKMKS